MMSDKFPGAYAELTAFLSGHPEVEIGESVISIPENVRPDFYARFNSARNAFVEEKFPECLNKAARLQGEYAKAAETASRWISLEDTQAVNSVMRFLRDPRESLSRELFDPLFDLLKGRETRDSFEERASGIIRGLFPVLYRGAYEKWVILSLAVLLEINGALRVPVRELQPGDRGKSAAFVPAEEVPQPVSSARFHFSQPLKAIFAAPDFIVHSARLNRFVGIRSEFREGICHAINASYEREWLPVDADLLKLLAKGLTLIYTADKPEKLSLVADATKLCRPDLVLWCIDAGTLSREDALQALAAADDRLGPAGGSFVIAAGAWPDNGEAPLSPDASGRTDGAASGRIRVLAAGLDRQRLTPAIDALCGAGDSAEAN